MLNQNQQKIKMREDISMKLIFRGTDEDTGEEVIAGEVLLGDTKMNGANSIDYQIKFDGVYEK